MSNVGTLIYFRDNPGFLAAKCIHVYRTARRFLGIGRYFLGVVRYRVRLEKIAKKKIVMGVCLSRAQNLYRVVGGYYVRFDGFSAYVVQNDTRHIVSTDVNWVLPSELVNSLAFLDARVRYAV